MKLIIGTCCFLILYSCSLDKEEEIYPLKEEDLKHFELGFDLDEPEFILNDIAKGELDRNIHTVLRQSFDEFPEPVEKVWEFSYLPGSDRVSEMIYYNVHYARCQKTRYTFNYNQQNLIETVVHKRTNICQDFEVDRLYTFNYNEKGLLKSIFMDNDYSVEENYFSYYPNGKIKEIYNDYRNRGNWEANYLVQKFYYDSTFTNVVKVHHFGTSYYNYSYEYFYDSEVNPFKDFFIAVSVFLPEIGPSYLSTNNVIKMVKRNEDHNNSFAFPFEYVFNYSNNVLSTYADKDEDKIPYIYFTVNP